MPEEEVAAAQTHVKPPDTSHYTHICHSDDREKWLKARSQGIGASESSTILGMNPYESAYTLYQRRVGNIPPIEDNEYMEWGRRLEDAVALKFRDETGQHIQRNGWMLRSRAYPWLTATPDYDVLGERTTLPNGCLHDRVAEGVLECKTANHFADEDWQDEAPPQYQCQVQHQLVVTGRQSGAIACLIGGNRFRWAPQQAHERFQRLLIQKTEEFWKSLQGELPPPLPDAHPSTSETLKKMIANGEVIQLPDVVLGWHEGYQTACRDEKDARDRKDQYANLIRSCIGEAEYGLMPEPYGSYSFRSVKEKTIHIPEHRQLRYSKKKPKPKK